MKAPLSWLREYVAVDLPVEELAERLAMTGTEVERVSLVGVPPDERIKERFVVGKVLTCGRHPNADRLSVCTVDVGEERPRTIVCGAPNVRAGQTVAVCLPGAVMPNGLEIKEAKLRGVVSSGMIMSEEELGFAPKSTGIMELPDVWEAGELLADRLPISEHILEVEVTPNRPDCLSIRGLAREIAAITGETFEEEISICYPCVARRAEEDIAVEVWDPDLCPRYAARVIRGVKVAESPTWLKARLMHAGMRPVNNVVDVTNYVMWAVGQPLHAFDLATIRGRKIIARRAYEGETIRTLDGVDRVLSPDMLVIADAERPSVIAGIMGSLDSEIRDTTTDILLEGANFYGGSILRTSAALGLRSESSTRFEKGLDPNLAILGLDMACQMIAEICGGEVSSGTVDVRAGDWLPWQVGLRPSRVESVLGVWVEPDEIEVILGRLGCNVVDSGDDSLTVIVPTFRRDLQREIDLIEEIARIHGLENLPSTIPGRTEGRGGLSWAQRAVRHVEDALSGCGLEHVITYSFCDPGFADRLRLLPDDPRRAVVRLANPLSVDQSVMRSMLLPGLLATAAYNVAQRNDAVRIFEVGKIFVPREERDLPDEPRHLGVLLLGDWEEKSWTHAGVPTDYYLGKGVVERLLAAFGAEARFERGPEPFLHPGKSARVLLGDEFAGWLGELHPLVMSAYDLPGPAVACEVDVDLLLQAAVPVRMFEDLITYPGVEQDLALVVDEDMPAAQVLEAVRTLGGPLLREVRLFDVYQGAQLGGGKKSLALRLVYQSSSRTLSEAEVNELRAELLAALHAQLGAELRGQ